MKMIRNGQPHYVSPKVKVLEIKPRTVLCLSGDINDMYVDEDGGGLFI